LANGHKFKITGRTDTWDESENILHHSLSAKRVVFNSSSFVLEHFNKLLQQVEKLQGPARTSYEWTCPKALLS
jgi:hypothetical protein